MNAPAFAEHLRLLHVDLSLSPTGQLHVEAPSGALTDELRSELAAHRDELVAALSVVPTTPPQLLGWPPPAPSWWAEWAAEDDARRAALMAAAKARLALRR
jgi:TubC N-terminal docking domain